MSKKQTSIEPASTSNGLSPWMKLIVTSFLVLVALAWWVIADYQNNLPTDAVAKYVGRKKCVECHQQQHDEFHNSHHDLAMDVANAETVRGDFNNASLEHYGVTSTMFVKNDEYYVNTEGPDGEMADFQIKYVFGYEPLQQYLVEFDRTADHKEDEIARLQVLRVSWDTEKQRWFYLNPPDVDEKLAPDDALHWTGIAQRWNNMCADCHSTNLQKRFNDKTGEYHTTYSEIDVSCEACHGPGSLHLDIVANKTFFWDQNHYKGLAQLKSDDSNLAQVQSCAPCHSRRRIVHPEYHAGDNFHNHFSNEVLRPETYHADGQIMDEVYVYGSFIQSKMYHKGIKCTDCHNPHTAKIKFEDNKLCTSCHAHNPGKYDLPGHHQHKVGSTGASCVECHMPESTYMKVDPRRDHSLRVPRPDLSVKINTPNSCTRCHLDRAKISDQRKQELKLEQYNDWLRAADEGHEDIKSALAEIDKWAAESVEKWFPDDKHRPPHFAEALSASWNAETHGQSEIIELLKRRDTVGIAKASALLWIDGHHSAESKEALIKALDDFDPQVRIAALQSMQGFQDRGADPYRTIRLRATPLLNDNVRSVRTAAAQVCAQIPRENLSIKQARALDKCIEELKLGVLVNNDRAAAHLTLGTVYERLGNFQRAEESYRTAIRVEPGATGPRANLATLLENRIQGAGQAMQQMRDPAELANLQEQLGTWSEEIKILRAEELVHFERDAGYAPENASVQYRYGLALYRNGEMDKATEYIRLAHELEPQTIVFMMALSRLLQTQGKLNEALVVAKKLVEADDQYQDLIEELELQLSNQSEANDDN